VAHQRARGPVGEHTPDELPDLFCFEAWNGWEANSKRSTSQARSATPIVRAVPLAHRGNDLYQTPECAVPALLKVESLPRVISEPPCVPGAIVRVHRRRPDVRH
jgi:hypothetical protein